MTITIEPTPSFTLPYTGELSITPSMHEELPALPEGIPAPAVSIEFEDGAWTYIELFGQSIHFWTDQNEGTQNSWHNDKTSVGGADGDGTWEDRLTAEQIEDILEWGAKVHERIDCFVYSFMTDAANGALSRLITALATDNTDAAAKIPGVIVTND